MSAEQPSDQQPSDQPGAASGTGTGTGTDTETDTDSELATRLATGAGELLLALRRDWAATGDASGLKDAGDRAAHEYLMAALAHDRPTDAVLSEEGADSPARLSAGRVWIVDPLDGTREYGDGRGDWAVHVALWCREPSGSAGRLTAGAVALPVAGVTLRDDPPIDLPARVARPPVVVVSRSRPPREAAALVTALGGEQVTLGSAGAKVAAVLRGEADVYVHSGGQHEWDSAAPVAVALAAGLHASRLDGSPLVYNRRDTLVPDLLVCRNELAGPVLAALAQAADPAG